MVYVKCARCGRSRPPRELEVLTLVGPPDDLRPGAWSCTDLAWCTREVGNFTGRMDADTGSGPPVEAVVLEVGAKTDKEASVVAFIAHAGSPEVVP